MGDGDFRDAGDDDEAMDQKVRAWFARCCHEIDDNEGWEPDVAKGAISRSRSSGVPVYDWDIGVLQLKRGDWLPNPLSGKVPRRKLDFKPSSSYSISDRHVVTISIFRNRSRLKY